jgi:pyridoxal phosphate enzyme (YggS family)
MTEIQDNISRVKERIALSAERAGREPEEVRLVAITKTFPARAIAEAYDHGLREYGENQVQEAEFKVLWTRNSGMDLRWHMVGHLQRNKAKRAIQLFDVIQSVDSVRLARELSKRSKAVDMDVPIMLEVNVSGEQSKFGFALDAHDQQQQERFLEAVEKIAALPHLALAGLMTIAPFDAPESVLRHCFGRLRELRGKLREEFPAQNWQHLSMGMTDDFEVAIEEGSTIVRIGRAIFGERRDYQEAH